MVTMPVYSKWIIDLKGLEGYVIGNDKNIYRLPFTSGLRTFGLRLIKQDKSNNRWRLNNRWWSENQLRQHLRIDQSMKELIKEDDLPF